MNFKPNFKTKEELRADQPKYEPVSNYMVNVNDLVTFSPDQTIKEVIDIIIDKKISGAPVLDNRGKLIGMLSEKDCLRIIIDQAPHKLPIASRKVSDYMTADVKTVPPDSDVVSAANQFLHSPMRRMPVVDNGVLKGQISRRDILKAAKNFKVTTW
ncbi:MAG: CBS domain-containing protein [Cyclobacteriaceae bacterium]|nr:CBS domain-containing protein [Cyclobacteriaceae bacterium]